MQILTKAITAILLLVLSSFTLAATGPIILGGDDLDDHGSRAGAVNIAGWAYGEAAANSILLQETAYAGVGITVDYRCNWTYRSRCKHIS